jgi:hypothetical protein
MKQKCVLILALLAGCASKQAAITAPSVIFEQEAGPADVGFPEGPVDVKYNVQIQNNWSQPLTAVRVVVQSLNIPGGAYTLIREFHTINAVIPPGESRVVSFWAKATGYGRTMRTGEPVSIRAVVYFDTPIGTYQSVISQDLPQQGSW